MKVENRIRRLTRISSLEIEIQLWTSLEKRAREGRQDAEAELRKIYEEEAKEDKQEDPE